MFLKHFSFLEILKNLAANNVSKKQDNIFISKLLTKKLKTTLPFYTFLKFHINNISTPQRFTEKNWNVVRNKTEKKIEPTYMRLALTLFVVTKMKGCGTQQRMSRFVSTVTKPKFYYYLAVNIAKGLVK